MQAKDQSCAYCGAPATTMDHVPPKGLFPKARRGELKIVKVPACTSCNNGRSEDDEYFRLMLVSLCDQSPVAQEVWHSAVHRSHHEHGSLLPTRFFSRMSLVRLKTPGGVYTGQKATAIHPTDDDWVRWFGVENHIGRGLYWAEFRHRPPQDYDVRTRFIYSAQIKELLPFLTLRIDPKTSDMFCYAFARVNDTPSSIIITSYYDKITFATFVAPPGHLKEPPEGRPKEVLDLRH